MRFVVLAGLVLLGCGDPRVAFVGEFAGLKTLTVTASDGRESTVTSSYSVEIEAPEGDEVLHFLDGCGLRATVSGSTYSLQHAVCPGAEVSFDDGSTCTQTITYHQGTGTLSGNLLDATHTGVTELSECSDGFAATYTFEEVISAQHQQ